MACPAHALAIEYCATKGFAVLEGPPSSGGALNPAAPHAVRNPLKKTRRNAAFGNDGYLISSFPFKLRGEQLPVRRRILSLSQD
jgi:hypothetical protein